MKKKQWTSYTVQEDCKEKKKKKEEVKQKKWWVWDKLFFTRFLFVEVPSKLQKEEGGG